MLPLPANEIPESLHFLRISSNAIVVKVPPKYRVDRLDLFYRPVLIRRIFSFMAAFARPKRWPCVSNTVLVRLVPIFRSIYRKAKKRDLAPVMSVVIFSNSQIVL